MSMYRNAIWIVKGLKEYTQGSYLSAAKRFIPGDLDEDCTGKQYMITGSNSGIGKQAALEIARRGGTVHMVCRNPKYAEDAKNELVESTENHNIHVHILDLSNPKEVLRFASEFTTKNSEIGLNVLINNAGCMVNTREVTDDGLEKNFATNTLGTYLLTEGLITLLQTPDPDNRSDPQLRSRVITVSSGGMLTNKLDPSDLQWEQKTFDGTMVYAQNKRQQIVMTEQYASKCPNIFFASMHPGTVMTKSKS